VGARQQEARVHRPGDAHPYLRRCDGQGDRGRQEPGLDRARRARGVPLRVVARLALAVLCASAATSNNAIFLYDTKGGALHQATTGLPQRHAADLRTRGAVSLLRERS
jgi:hypothetical protein